MTLVAPEPIKTPPRLAIRQPPREPIPGTLSRRRTGGRIAPVCDDNPRWCGLTLYQHQAPHREAIVIEVTEMEDGEPSRRRIEICSWPCVENLAAARTFERAEDEAQRGRRQRLRDSALSSRRRTD